MCTCVVGVHTGMCMHVVGMHTGMRMYEALFSAVLVIELRTSRVS